MNLKRISTESENDLTDERTIHPRKPVVDIIIVNWNSGSQINNCLGQIERAVNKGFDFGRVVVVDNASSDFSAANLTVRSGRLVVLRNARNLGFAAACNQGAKESRADYLLFMNPDVYLCEDSLRPLIEFLGDPANCNVGICAPRLVDQNGRTQKTCARFPRTRDFCVNAVGLDRVLPSVFRSSLMREWSHGHDRMVDQVMGACLLVRRSVFEQLNGFDEVFFVYFEEVDLCLRCTQAGWDVWFLSKATAIHTGGGCSRQVPAQRLFYSLRSRMQYALKHFSAISAAVLCFVTIFIEPFPRAALAVVRGSVKELRSTCEAYRLLWGFMPSLLQARTHLNSQSAAVCK